LIFNGCTIETIGDTVTVYNKDDIHLIGHSFVIGLDGTGDTRLIDKHYLDRSMPKDFDKKTLEYLERSNSQNIASVIVTSTIKASSNKGDRHNVFVSSIENAESLENGILLRTVLKDLDGTSFAIAQGLIEIDDNSNMSIVYNGAIVYTPRKETLFTFNETSKKYYKP
jgi:flagellar P-ring protein FlgI